MTTLNYDRLNQTEQQQVQNLVAELEGAVKADSTTVRFVAKGVTVPQGGEFSQPEPN